MLDPRTLTHAQLASVVADVQKILWQESKPIPDFPREYGDYWNPAKQEDGDKLEQIADVLVDADLMPPDFMPVDLAVLAAPPRVLDAIELLWAARILNSLDLPECPLDYDGRRTALAKVIGAANDSLPIGNPVSLPMAAINRQIRLATNYCIDRIPQVYFGLKGLGAEGVILKCRRSFYDKHPRPGIESRDWVKRRFKWD
jgi:hypothetical protein